MAVTRIVACALLALMAATTAHAVSPSQLQQSCYTNIQNDCQTAVQGLGLGQNFNNELQQCKSAGDALSAVVNVNLLGDLVAYIDAQIAGLKAVVDEAIWNQVLTYVNACKGDLNNLQSQLLNAQIELAVALSTARKSCETLYTNLNVLLKVQANVDLNLFVFTPQQYCYNTLDGITVKLNALISARAGLLAKVNALVGLTLAQKQKLYTVLYARVNAYVAACSYPYEEATAFVKLYLNVVLGLTSKYSSVYKYGQYCYNQIFPNGILKVDLSVALYVAADIYLNLQLVLGSVTGIVATLLYTVNDLLNGLLGCLLCSVLSLVGGVVGVVGGVVGGVLGLLG